MVGAANRGKRRQAAFSVGPLVDRHATSVLPYLEINRAVCVHHLPAVCADTAGMRALDTAPSDTAAPLTKLLSGVGGRVTLSLLSPFSSLTLPGVFGPWFSIGNVAPFFIGIWRITPHRPPPSGAPTLGGLGPTGDSPAGWVSSSSTFSILARVCSAVTEQKAIWFTL